MARALILSDTRQKEFKKIFDKACYRHSSWQVWSDFVFMSAVSMQNAVDQHGELHDEREQEYLTIAERYNEEEMELLTKLFAVTAEALEENPKQDFLGTIFMGLGLNSHWHGQFFTPYHICDMMGWMQLERAENEIESRGWIGIMDPCCGGGALLIAARNVLAEQGLGYGTAWYEAQDIDRTTALMCYIQLALLGCAGRVVVGNSLSMEEKEVWTLPANYLPIWQMRLLFGLSPAPISSREEAGEIATTEEPVELRVEETGQLTLF